MTQQLLNPLFQAFDGSGNPLSNGYVWTYVPGTSTPKAAYTDPLLTTPWSNPIPLDGSGQALIYLSGAYKIAIYDQFNNLIRTIDNQPGLGSNLSALLSDYASLQSAISAIGSNNTTLYINTSTTIPISTNVTVPSNITLEFLRGGFIDGSDISTSILTINGGISKGLEQSFGSNITINGSYYFLRKSTVSSLSNLSTLPNPNVDKMPITVLFGVAKGDNAGGDFFWNSTSMATPVTGYVVSITGVVTGRWVRIDNQTDAIYTQTFGDKADGTDDYTAITAALSYASALRGSTIQNPVVKMRSGGNYGLSTGLTIPWGVTLDANGSFINYTGSGVAVTAGDRSGTLNYFTNFINFSIKLNNHSAKGLKTLATTRSYYNGYIEGYTVGITNARTCIGVEINGGSISSFDNVYNISCNHLHIGFKITSSGGSGSQPTMHTFLNCEAVGDQALDNSSYGWFFDDLGLSGLGDGTKIVGCNVESCNIGMYFGDGSRNIDVNARWEISVTATSRTVKFHSNSSNINIAGAGLQAASMGSVSGGIEGFSNGKHFLFSDNNGHTRLCGNDTDITSGYPTLAIGHTDILTKKSNYTKLFTRDDTTGTGGYFIQPGSGSNAHGAFLELMAHSSGGSGKAGWSAGGANNYFQFLNGFGGGVIFQIQTDGIIPGADNTYYCGLSGARWKDVYSMNASCNTSDEREKEKVMSIDDDVLDAWSEIDFIQYKWIKDDGQTHFGVIAQRIEEVFEKRGLNAVDYGILVYDGKNDIYSVRITECLILEMALLRRTSKNKGV